MLAELSLRSGYVRSTFFSSQVRRALYMYMYSYMRAWYDRRACSTTALWSGCDWSTLFRGKSTRLHRTIVVRAALDRRACSKAAIKHSRTHVERARAVRRPQSTQGGRTMHARSSYVFTAAVLRVLRPSNVHRAIIVRAPYVFSCVSCHQDATDASRSYGYTKTQNSIGLRWGDFYGRQFNMFNI